MTTQSTGARALPSLPPYLEDLWRRREELWPPICPLDTGKAYAESLAWNGDRERALEVARGVLAYTEEPPNAEGYTEKHYFVAVSRDLMAVMLASAPETTRTQRDVSLALALAERNVEYFPGDSLFHTTLGIAQYRAGLWDKAIATLQEADRHDKGNRIAPRGFVLAMAHCQKGESVKAGELLARTTAWMNENRPEHPELLPFRDEAVKLLGRRIADPDMSLPADPFAN